VSDLNEDVVVLFRPVGPEELWLIEQAAFAAFPPRLPEQPIFYPVTNEVYATQIARDWNTQYGSRAGYVTRFRVVRAYLDQFERKIVGGRVHEEYWIPAERLAEFNDNIVGEIEVIARFEASDERAMSGEAT
jgi:hypothetical protein